MGSASRRKQHRRTRGKGAQPRQDLLLVLMAFHTGMREGELRNLRNSDIDLHGAKVRVPDYDDPDRFRAIKHDNDHQAEHIAHTGIDGVLNQSLARSEIVQLKRIGTLIRFGVRWACDFPYYEIGHNATGGQSYSLNVREDDDDDWQEVTRGESWEELFLATERTAGGNQWWSREPGARQRVYDLAYAHRLSVRDDSQDAHDVALGAADYPELDFIDYFIPWVRVSRDEVRNNAMAMKLIAIMEEEIPGLAAELFPESTN